jgi:hypothetical protein
MGRELEWYGELFFAASGVVSLWKVYLYLFCSKDRAHGGTPDVVHDSAITKTLIDSFLTPARGTP